MRTPRARPFLNSRNEKGNSEFPPQLCRRKSWLFTESVKTSRKNSCGRETRTRCDEKVVLPLILKVSVPPLLSGAWSFKVLCLLNEDAFWSRGGLLNKVAAILFIYFFEWDE